MPLSVNEALAQLVDMALLPEERTEATRAEAAAAFPTAPSQDNMNLTSEDEDNGPEFEIIEDDETLSVSATTSSSFRVNLSCIADTETSFSGSRLSGRGLVGSGVARGEFDSDDEVEIDESISRVLTAQEIAASTRAERQFQKLRFSAPGAKNSIPDLNLSRAERRRKSAKRAVEGDAPVSSGGRRSNTRYGDDEFSAYHDAKGNLIVNGNNMGRLCDCLWELCTGCHTTCAKCDSGFCSFSCQKGRNNVVITTQDEGNVSTIRFNPYYPQALRRLLHQL